MTDSIVKCTLLFLLLVVFAHKSVADPLVDQSSILKSSWAESVCAGKVVSIDALNTNVGVTGGVLYKAENVHGSRGPTFLVQNPTERTGKQVIEIRNARCEPIATLGLFATDQPYGARYYSLTGGSGHDAESLYNLGSLVGSTNILVEGLNKWILVHNPFERDGDIRK